MPVAVKLPGYTLRLCHGRSPVVVEAGTVADCLERLEAMFPGIKSQLCDADDRVEQHVNIYVNDEDVRFLRELATPLKDGDEVYIVPALAGGQESQFREEGN